MNAEVSITEFPFVAEMPKREKSKLAKLWDELSVARDTVEEHGALLPMYLAAELMNVSRQRVDQLLESGKLQGAVVFDKRWVLQSSVEAWAREEHKAGRPLKHLETIEGAIKTTRKAYRAAMDEARSTTKKKK